MAKKTNAVGELIFGIHPVIELLKAKKRKLISIYTTKPEPKAFDHIKKLMPAYHVAIQYVSREVLNKMAGTTDHQGVVAWAQPMVTRKKFFETSKQPFLVMLDGVQDVQNVGAILRSAHCTGVNGVILCKKGGALITGAAMKASAGLAEHIDVYVAASPQEAIQLLKEAGYNIFLTTFDGENATVVDYQAPLCIVIGNEATGVTKDIMKSGKRITLPQKSSDISYNASVAAGIILFFVATKNKFI